MRAKMAGGSRWAVRRMKMRRMASWRLSQKYGPQHVPQVGCSPWMVLFILTSLGLQPLVASVLRSSTLGPGSHIHLTLSQSKAQSPDSAAAPSAPSSPLSSEGVHGTPPLMTSTTSLTRAPIVDKSGASLPKATISGPVKENGTLLGSVTLNSTASGLAYDSLNSALYVSVTSGVAILNGSRLIQTINVTGTPTAVAFDASNGLVYVADSTSGQVTVINGTRVVTNITVGSAPDAIAYDSFHSYIYVANFNSNNLTVISGARVITSLATGTGPDAIGYDSASGEIYVANYYSTDVSVFNGTKTIGSVAVGGGPTGIAGDSANHEMYVSSNAVYVIKGTTLLTTIVVPVHPDAGIVYNPGNELIYVANGGNGGTTLLVLNGTGFVTNVSLGSLSPGQLAYDPLNGILYVTADSNYGSKSVDFVSTLLAITPAIPSPIGSPANSADVGDGIVFAARVWALGSGGDLARSIAQPYGLGCLGVSLTQWNLQANASLSCQPTAPGTYTVWINTTDGSGASVTSEIGVEVFPPLSAGNVTVLAGTVRNPLAIDVGEPVNLTDHVTGGSGGTVYSWKISGPMLNCSNRSYATISCIPGATGALNVRVTVTDTEGSNSTSTALSVPITSAMIPRPPTATLNPVDIQVLTRLAEVVSGGSGTYTNYTWDGLPTSATCTQPLGGYLDCRFAEMGVYPIAVSVRDSDGATVSSPFISLQVDLLPTVSSPTVNRSALDVGQFLGFSTTALGGSGTYIFTWSGLPIGCGSTNASSGACVVTGPGLDAIYVFATDSVGGQSSLSQRVLVSVSSDPKVIGVDIAPSNPVDGLGLWINATVTGGSGGNVYNWSGLPPGCQGIAASISCTPTEPGIYYPSLSVADSNGFSARYDAKPLVVAPALMPPSPAPLSSTTFYVEIAAFAVIAVCAGVAAGIVLRSRKARRPPDSLEADAEHGSRAS